MTNCKVKQQQQKNFTGRIYGCDGRKQECKFMDWPKSIKTDGALS